MITEQLLKTNFSGRDGFSWWIGRVAHSKYWKKENLASGMLGSEDHRVKVRIIGYHPWDDTLSEADLPWANVMMDAVTGSGQGSMGDTLNLVGGETAIGFFMDGEEAQQPVIIGLLHRSKEVDNSSISESEIFTTGSNQFKPFTGFPSKNVAPTKRATELTKVKDPVAKKNSPYIAETGIWEGKDFGTVGFTTDFGVDLGLSTAFASGKNYFDAVSEDSNIFLSGNGSAALDAFTRVATKKQVDPSLCDDNTIGDIAQALNDFIAFASVLESFGDKFIDPLRNKIIDMEQKIKNIARRIQRIIKAALDNIRTGLIKRIMSLFRIFAAANKKFNPLDFFLGPAAQKAFKKILKIIFCLFDNIFGDLFGFITNILKSMLGRLFNTGACAVTQFTSSILGKVMDNVKNLASPILSGINWLTGGLANITDVLSKASSFARKILRFLECTGVKCDETSEWVSNFGGSVQVKADKWEEQLDSINFLGGFQKDLVEVEKKLGKQKLARWIAGENLDEAKKTIINGSNVLDLLKTLDKITDGKTLELFEKGGFGSIEAAIASYSIFGNGANAFGDCTNRIYNPQTQDDLISLPIGVKHPQCIPPVAEIRGTGTGAVVKPIVGNNRQIFSIEVLNGGSGYDSSTKITIIDKSGHGEGATGNVIVEDGVVKSIVLTDQGSNYCGGDLNVGGIDIGIGTDVSGIVTSIFVSAPGLGYTSGDTFTLVGSGVTGTLTVTPNGSIISAQLPINYNLEFNRRPTLLLNSESGFNGSLTPIMKYNAQLITDKDGSSGVRPLIGITSVIDCPPKEHFFTQNQTVESTQSTTTTTSISTPTTPTETTEETTTPTIPTQTTTPEQTSTQTTNENQSGTSGMGGY